MRYAHWSAGEAEALRPHRAGQLAARGARDFGDHGEGPRLETLPTDLFVAGIRVRGLFTGYLLCPPRYRLFQLGSHRYTSS